jgi:acetyl-CoA acetyltransferase
MMFADMDGREFRDRVAIVGVGATKQGTLPGSTALGLAVDAFEEALRDAGLRKEDIDGLLTMPGTTSSEGARHYLRLAQVLGINPSFTGTLSMGGATAGVLVQLGAMAIIHGLATYVACVFGDNAKSGGSRFAGTVAGQDPDWGLWGMFGAAANSALGARRHMHLYGTRPEHLAEVAIACRYHASLNPNAVMRKPITLDDYFSSRLIVDPLRLLDCCLITDGGVAIILGPVDRAKDLRNPPVLVSGWGQAHTAQTLEKKDWWYCPHQKDAISRAYRMAGVGPQDIQLAQLYDNFTIAVIFWLEHAGFCAPGEGGPFLEGGAIRLGGRLPVNTAGGNLSESYMQGWLHIVEAVRQLRGECGPRQVPNAECCLVTGRGVALNTASALVLRRG